MSTQCSSVTDGPTKAYMVDNVDNARNKSIKYNMRTYNIFKRKYV